MWKIHVHVILFVEIKRMILSIGTKVNEAYNGDDATTRLIIGQTVGDLLLLDVVR